MKKNVAIIFGGKSTEHDISILTACQVMNALNKNKYNLFPVYISQNGKWIIVFNGEIYNYKELRDELKERGYSFVSKSDTEVVLNSFVEWEDKAARKLNGMFAIAAYNSERKIFE